MSDVYSAGLWGEPPGASTDAELERRRFDRTASGAARTGAVVGSALDWLTPNLIGEAVGRVESEANVLSDRLAGFSSEPVLSAEDANARYGIEGALSFSEPATERWAAHRFERTQRELARQDVIARAEEGGPVSDFALSLGVGLIDPINLAFPFGRINSLRAALPGLAAAEAGQALAPRIAARGAFGVIEGAAFSTALEPAMFGLAQLGERDYGLDDSLINVIAGAGVGGIVNAAGGFFRPSAEAQAERARLPEEIRTASPEARASAALHAVQALSEGQPVRAAEVFQGRSSFASFADYDNAVGAAFERRAGDVPENALPAGIARGIARPQADGAVVRAEIARADETVTTAWGAELRARAGQDYILSDDGGERWVVRRDLFEATYERAEGGYRKRADQVVGFWVSPDRRAIRTLEGEVTAEPGDIVLVGALGEMWPVKRARFEQRYERLRAPRRPAPPDDAAVNADRASDDAPVLQTDRRAEGRAEVEADIAAWVAPVFGEDAAPIARVIANGFDNLGAYYGESAKDVTDAIGLTLRRGASDDIAIGKGGRLLEQSAWPVVYHGSAAPLNNIRPILFATPDRPTAAFFARLDRKLTRGMRRVTPLEVGFENPLIIEGKGYLIDDPTMRQGKLYQVIEQAIADGHDGIVFKDVIDGPGDPRDADPIDVYIVLDPAKVRQLPPDFVDAGPMMKRFLGLFGARQLFQPSRARATTAKERRELRRAIKRADEAVALSERQGVAFAAAAACIAREGFGSAGHGLAELMAGLGGGLSLSIPVGLIASNAAADNVNPRDPDEWLRRIRAHAQATLPLDQFGMIDAPLAAGDDPALADLDWSAPGRNEWTPPEPADAPGRPAGMNPEGFKVPPTPAGFNDKTQMAPDDAEALIQLFGPLLALDSEEAAR